MFTTTGDTDQYQSLAMLGDTETEPVKYPRLNGISEVRKGLLKADENGAVVPPGQVRNVLDEDGFRSQSLDNGDKALPEVSPLIVGDTLAVLDEFGDPRTTGATERLAGHPPGDEVDRLDFPDVERL